MYHSVDFGILEGLEKNFVHTVTHQAMQNQNNPTVICTGTSYKARSSNTNCKSRDLLQRENSQRKRLHKNVGEVGMMYVFHCFLLFCFMLFFIHRFACKHYLPSLQR